MSSCRMRIRNAQQLVVVCSNGERMKCGSEMDVVEIIENGTVVVGNDGLIEAVGRGSELAEKYANVEFETDIDASGKTVIPGLVDAHTHPVWSGDRVGEFALKLAGATYMDLHKMGAGINFTVRHTRKSDKEELKSLLYDRLDRMLKMGTTLVEAKSGYGLDCETEMKMLEVIHEAKMDHKIELVSSFLGAHAVPLGSTEEEAANDVMNVQLPELKKRMEEGKMSPSFIDVFHEKGVFTSTAREILERGKNDYGLKLNFHGDELNFMGSAELAAELDAVAVSHLEHISEEGMKVMAAKKVVAVVLPSTFYLLRLTPPPVRDMIAAGVPVALATDYNPNAYCLSMPLTMNMGCVLSKMTMNEAFVASTLNAAASIDCSHSHGSIEVGKVGDFVILNAPRWEHLIYQMVDPPVETVIKRGEVVYE